MDRVITQMVAEGETTETVTGADVITYDMTDRGEKLDASMLK